MPFSTQEKCVGSTVESRNGHRQPNFVHPITRWTMFWVDGCVQFEKNPTTTTTTAATTTTQMTTTTTTTTQMTTDGNRCQHASCIANPNPETFALATWAKSQPKHKSTTKILSQRHCWNGTNHDLIIILGAYLFSTGSFESPCWLGFGFWHFLRIVTMGFISIFQPPFGKICFGKSRKLFVEVFHGLGVLWQKPT